MTPTLTILEPRLVPASPFPDAPHVPYHLRNLPHGELIAAAGDGGGPRLVRLDATGEQVWSVYVADPDTRRGVNPEAVDLLLSAGGVQVLSTATVQPVPAGVDVAANLVGRGFGLPDEATIAVGLVYSMPPGDSVQEQQARLFASQDTWTALADSGQIDPYAVYVAAGADLSVARAIGERGGRYIEVRADGLDPETIASEVMGRLST